MGLAKCVYGLLVLCSSATHPLKQLAVSGLCQVIILGLNADHILCYCIGMP